MAVRVFLKTLKALINTAKQNNYPMRILQAVEEVNDEQKSFCSINSKSIFNGDLRGKRIAIWGLAFKPETDDMREAPSLVLIEKLLAAG